MFLMEKNIFLMYRVYYSNYVVQMDLSEHSRISYEVSSEKDAVYLR